MTDYFTGIAIAIIIFLVCICLVIFAPRSHNFFKHILPLDTLAKNKSLMQDTFVRLGIKLDDINLAEEYTQYYNTIKPQKIEWKQWPDNTVEGNISYLPIYLFSKINSCNYNIFNKLFNAISQIEGIQSTFFVQIDANSKFIKHKGWANLTNNTLRFIYCFNSFCYDEDECGIWINGEVKKLFKDYYYIYDASKEHSIYNNTSDNIIFLFIDFDRPKEVAPGYSDVTLTIESLI